ncbi:MAG TPA: hypothetical protein VEU08_20675 [Vicinamibacterales bacterium]|nr:hypothetical protein [Vicinamibacterales bacterium]
MTTRLFLASAAAAVLTSGLAAQQNPTAAPDGGHIVLTGCLEHADEVRNPVANDTTLDSLTFILTRALPSTSSTSAAAAAVGTTGTMPRSYRLEASVQRLGTHVGQRIEITGTLAERPTEPAGTGTAANTPRVAVDSVKVIAAICPR